MPETPAQRRRRLARQRKLLLLKKRKAAAAKKKKEQDAAKKAAAAKSSQGVNRTQASKKPPSQAVNRTPPKQPQAAKPASKPGATLTRPEGKQPKKPGATLTRPEGEQPKKPSQSVARPEPSQTIKRPEPKPAPKPELKPEPKATPLSDEAKSALLSKLGGGALGPKAGGLTPTPGAAIDPVRPPNPLAPGASLPRPGGSIPVKPGGPTPTVPKNPGPTISQDHRASFAKLHAGFPLLMLPVRLETRFDGPGRALKIRIYPDQIHLDEHAVGLSAEEIQLAKDFWRMRHAAGKSREGQRAAERWLCEQIDPRRAAWIARKLRPQLAEGEGDALELRFPKLPPRKVEKQAVASCLPSRFAVVGVLGGTQRFIQFGRPVAAKLAVAPALGEVAAYSEDPKAPVDPAMAWMVDYDEAVAAGMAITVDLRPAQLAEIQTKGLDQLLVVGIDDARPLQAAGALQRLLQGHLYTDGLEFTPQGTPTNNTDSRSAGWTAGIDDLDGWFERELDGVGVATHEASEAAVATEALGLIDAKLLGRVRNGDRREGLSAAAMNRVLWPVTWGRYLDDLLAPGTGGKSGRSPISSAVQAWARDWFIAKVRGGAPLPTLTVGAQPYGLLPVRPRVPRAKDAKGELAQLERVLEFMRARWRWSTRAVPRLDPVDGSVGGGTGSSEGADGADEDTVEILGALPHPERFVVRRLTDQRGLLTIFFDIIVKLMALPADEGGKFEGKGQWYLDRVAGLDDVDEQLRTLRTFLSRSQKLWPAHLRANAKTVIEALIGLAERHKKRQDPIPSLFPGLTEGVLDRTVHGAKHHYAGYGNATEDREFNRPLVEARAADGSTPEGAEAGGYLLALAAQYPPASKLSKLGGASPMASKLGAPINPALGPKLPAAPTPKAKPVSEAVRADEPLLYQLAEEANARVSGASASLRGAHGDALRTLAGRDADELRLRLTETLGLASHRLDAWLTSLATHRLDAMRQARSRGVSVGAFGWVEDLRPDAAGTRESEGFIHAPSLGHAATAAVLRAGWRAHGDDSPESSFAVDLRSDRVRLAKWILDGVRAGQELGDLLGQRFERRLHDDHLDHFIDPCRRLVLEALGEPEDARVVVDGLELAELYETTGILIEGERLKPQPRSKDPEREQLQDALDAIRAALDAVADAAVADGVHHLLEGNDAAAGASLDAIADGSAPPPELHSVRTPRSSVGVTHRVLVTLGVAAKPAKSGWGADGLSALDPGLDAWLTELLGDPARVGFVVVKADGTRSVVGLDAVLDEQGVSALTWVVEAPDGPTATKGDSNGSWARRLRASAAVRALEQLEPAEGDPPLRLETARAPRGYALSLDDLALVARGARSVLTRARPLDARDFQLPGQDDGDPRLRVGDCEARVEALRAALASAADALDGHLSAAEPELGPVRSALVTLAGCGLSPALPPPEADADALFDQAQRALDEARERLAAHAAASLDEGLAARAGELEARRELAEERLASLLEFPLPLLPRCVVADAGAVESAFARSDALLDGDPAKATGWLGQIAKVRPDAAKLDALTTHAELIADRSPSVAVAQLPVVADDPWAAVAAPKLRDGAREGRLCLWALDHGGLARARAGKTFTGLVVDSFTEQIPSDEVLTGVAMHFDAPSSRPPQTMLLITPPAGQTYDFDLVLDTLQQTLELAKLRAVDPDALTGYGHHVPAIYPRRIDAGPQTPTDDDEGGQG